MSTLPYSCHAPTPLMPGSSETGSSLSRRINMSLVHALSRAFPVFIFHHNYCQAQSQLQFSWTQLALLSLYPSVWAGVHAVWAWLHSVWAGVYWKSIPKYCNYILQSYQIKPTIPHHAVPSQAKPYHFILSKQLSNLFKYLSNLINYLSNLIKYLGNLST